MLYKFNQKITSSVPGEILNENLITFNDKLSGNYYGFIFSFFRKSLNIAVVSI